MQAKEYFHKGVKLQNISLLSVEVLILCRFNNRLQDQRLDGPDNANILFDFMWIAEFYIVVTLPNPGLRHTS